MKKILVTLAAVAALSGCNTTLTVDYDMADLAQPVPFAGTSKDTAIIEIEVAACRDYKDKALESDSVLKVKQKVSHYVPSAKLLKCSREGFNSALTYSVPQYVGVVPDDSPLDPDGVYIYRNGQAMSIFAGANLQVGLNKLSKAPTINVNAKNGGNASEVWAGDVFEYGEPRFDITYILGSGDSVAFTLNNVRAAILKKEANTNIGYITK
ncbi:membrane lipoprotein [Vibrio phage 1.244.A._10N.261.54.C3]|nr:membrane lipoprotein [Vibrio phage 1.244.A._10N.261.54.C3]AUR98751.1 membrane lipoprotein [Vibrio phage 1.255.O._10N.286.45.F1]